MCTVISETWVGIALLSFHEVIFWGVCTQTGGLLGWVKQVSHRRPENCELARGSLAAAQSECGWQTSPV